MKRIILPELPDVPLPFYLAVEEWAARYLPPDEYFFAWQVDPTIICGRHQDIASEVDLDLARCEGINVCRRKSGGGAVLADRNNVMFSYITPSSHVQTTFESYTGMICRMLRSLGIPAEPTGRNDIAVDGRKVAGNAFYKLPGRSIVHGTMLYDADFNLMSRVLTPSVAKRQSKGVVSVPSRVTTLRRLGLTLSCAGFVDYALRYLCPADAVTLRHEDIKAVEEIMATYLDSSFLRLDRAENRTYTHSAYIPGVGEIKADISTDSDGIIRRIDFSGDFFPLRPVDEHLAAPLTGLPLSRDALAAAIDAAEPGLTIAGLTSDSLLDFLFSDTL